MTRPHEETWEAVDGERAKLAACAPEMARMLLAVEWQGYMPHMKSTGSCPSCEGDEPRHAPDCAFDALLRKTGVR